MDATQTICQPSAAETQAISKFPANIQSEAYILALSGLFVGDF
jgi:hypothetical protein